MEHAAILNAHATHELKWIVSVLYPMIAFQMFHAIILSRVPNGPKYAIIALVVVFLACDFSSYFGVVVNAPEWMLNISHIAIILSSVWFILSRQMYKIISSMSD